LSSLSSLATAGSPSALHSTEGRKTDVLVQDFDLGEADLAQQVQLEQQRAGRVLLLDALAIDLPLLERLCEIIYHSIATVGQEAGVEQAGQSEATAVREMP